MSNVALIRVLAADDHPMIRAGLAAFLGQQADMEVVGEAVNGEEAIELYGELHPDVVLMDIKMPVMDGVEATRAIIAGDPAARIVMLTSFDGDEDIHRALEAGARGYLFKDMLRTEVVDVVRDVYRGNKSIPTKVAIRLAEHTPRHPLTAREIEVLQLVAGGLSNADVAAKIGRAEGTVKVHLKNILQKLGANDRTEAVTIALKRGFIRLL